MLSVMRTRQIPGEVPDAGYGGRVSPYAHAGAMGEQPAARDEQIGQMFRSMRSAMGVSRETIARRLATSPSTVDNFEAGAIAALPHWKETARIVRSYCVLLRMDHEPILRRIHDQLAVTRQPTEAGQSPSPPRAPLGQDGAAHGTPGSRSPIRADPAFARAPPPHAVCAQPHCLPRGCGNFGASVARTDVSRHRLAARPDRIPRARRCGLCLAAHRTPPRWAEMD